LLHIDVLRATWQQNVSATTASTLPFDVEKTRKWRGAKIIFQQDSLPSYILATLVEESLTQGSAETPSV